MTAKRICKLIDELYTAVCGREDYSGMILWKHVNCKDRLKKKERAE